MRKPIRRISTIQQQRLKEYAKVSKAFLKENPKCIFCFKKEATEVHHRFGRVSTLLCDVRGFLACCSTCHRWIHDNPREARHLGLLAPIGSWNNPKALEQYVNNPNQ